MINKLKLMKSAFKFISLDTFKNKESFENSLNQFLVEAGLPMVNLPDDQVPNQSLPAFDTLDFDEISDHFNDNS